MYTLEFLNNVHLDHFLNTTVRKGLKWANRLKIGDRIKLAKTGDSSELEAKIELLYICPLAGVPSFILDSEHDLNCRTFSGLMRAMRRAYGPLDFDQMVTCIGYQLIQKE